MKKKKDWKIYIPLIVVVASVCVGSVYWYIDYSSYVKTDDAVVASDIVTVSPKIMGRVAKLYVQEGDTVKAGQLLAELDSTDLLAQKRQMIAAKLQTEASKAQSEAKLKFDESNIKVLQIGVDKAKEDYDRSKAQFAGNVTTKEQFDHAKKALEIAQAQLDAAKAQLLVSRTQIKSAESSVNTSVSQIHIVSTQLNNTRLYAPCNGIVAKRWLLAGDIAQTGQSIFTISDNSNRWVAVYLEETKMETLRIGQKAKFELDMYPGVEFTGKIFSMGSTTASQFSLIPASNASGNFTKVTQRVPLKISIESASNGQSLSAFKFLSGMSAVVKIIK